MNNLSWIQYHVLIELTRHTDRRYSQLRPTDVEGNLFMYHLKGLTATGLVEKTEGKYQLTIKGLQLAGTLSLDTGKIRQQPKILNAIICRNDAGEYLMSRWRRQPNAGLVSFPHGMMHYGEAVSEAAQRELLEKAALTGNLSYRGDVYVRGELAGVLDRHLLVHLFEASDVQQVDDTSIRVDVSEPLWMPLAAFPPREYVPGFYEIAELVHRAPDGPVFADIVVDIVR